MLSLLISVFSFPAAVSLLLSLLTVLLRPAGTENTDPEPPVAMAQNIYDNPEFFEAFRQLRGERAEERAGGRLDQAGSSEQRPAVRLGGRGARPRLRDGWFSRWALTRGAASTHGIDVSEAQLGLAKESTEPLENAANATWEAADLDKVTLKENTYDLVFSSLALHYLKDINGVLKKIAASLKPGGSVYFSVEHPMYTAPHRRETCKGPTGDTGFRTGP